MLPSSKLHNANFKRNSIIRKMFKKKFLFAIFFTLISLSFLLFPNITKAYDSDSLKTDLDYFFGLGVKGYLVWQYSGNRLLNPIENDQFSFFSDDKAVCEILKAKSGTLKADQFIGVNMHSIVRHLDQADSIFGYLSSCGVTVVRTFATKDRGSVGDYKQLLGIAGNHNIKLIMALADWSNGTPGIIDPDTAYPDPGAWYTQAAQSGSPYSNYLSDLVGGLRGSAGLYGYELANEPHCGSQEGCRTPYDNWISASSSRIRSIDPSTNIGVGQAANLGFADTPSPGNFKLSNSAGGVTVTSGHYYTLEQRSNAAKAKGESDSLGKPFYIGEAGFSGGGVPGQEEEVETPCNKTNGNEFHNLRPYPKSPCNKKIEEVTLSCGNDLYVSKNFTIKPNGSTLDDLPSGCSPISSCGPGQKCTFQCSGVEAKISVDLSKAELPIAGNTELVPNQEKQDNTLTLAQRMNQYVSWYLNGTINMPFEDDLSKLIPSELTNRLVNYSGPLNKLLPWRVGIGARIQNVNDAIASLGGAGIRHDQIAVCSLTGTPIPCTAGVNILTQIITIGGLRTNRFSIWNDHRPPWEEDPKFKYVSDYWKAFIEWEGGHCTPSVNIAGHQYYVCDLALTGGMNFFAQYIEYLLPSSTEDRKGQVKLQLTQKEQTVGESKATNVVFTPDSDNHNLYFAHMQEDAELGKLLQGTYASAGQPGYASVDSDGKSFPAAPHCEVVDSRKNPGDRLYGDYNNPKVPNDKQISGKLKYDITFTCTMSTVPDGCFDTCQGGDASKTSECQKKCSPQCSQNTYAGISVFTKTPKAQEIWERLVDGPASVFKRFFPKVGADAPLTEIKDLPTVANASYKAVETGTLFKGIEAVAGDPSKNKPGAEAQLVIPYLGGVQEYFLKGIQKALRPQGLDDSGELAGTNNAKYDPGLNETPSTNNQCIKLSDAIPNPIDFRNTSVIPKSKEELYALIKNRFPTTQLLTYYDQVVARAKASGYNPAFVLTIWIEETGASDTQYGLVHDLGCGAGHGIDEQLDCFTNLYKDWSVGGKYYSDVKECLTNGNNPNFEDFMLLFAEGCQGEL